MKKLLVACLLCLPIFASAQSRFKAPRKSKTDPQVWEVTQSNVGLSYLDPKECDARFEKDAVLNRWTAEEQAAERAKIPAGGYLKSAWGRVVLSSASADNFVFLVEAPDGRQILRWKPQPSIPRLFTAAGTPVYSEVTMVPLPEPLMDGCKVFVIEESVGKRYEYIIRP